jgi:hypothetical protein
VVVNTNGQLGTAPASSTPTAATTAAADRGLARQVHRQAGQLRRQAAQLRAQAAQLKALSELVHPGR